MSVEAAISKASRRPMDVAKMRELLTKLRKGATATLTFGKLLQVLQHLGWTAEAIVGWTPRHYSYQDREHLVTTSTIQMSKDALEARHAQLRSLELTSLPDTPRAVRDVAVMDVGEIQKGAEHGSSHIYYFYWREWVGTGGLAAMSPAGASVEFLIDHHDLDRGRRSLDEGDSSTVNDIWRGLKENGIEDDINRALGTETHVPAALRTRENTGTCPACWGNYKLSNGRFVMHGYERPGYGFLKGQCFCVGYQPLEESDEGARDYQGFLVKHLDGDKALLARLQSGDVETVEGYGGRVVKKGEPAFRNLLEKSIDRMEHTIKQLTADVKFYGQILDAWEPRPMPQQGEPQRVPRFFLPKKG